MGKKHTLIFLSLAVCSILSSYGEENKPRIVNHILIEYTDYVLQKFVICRDCEGKGRTGITSRKKLGLKDPRDYEVRPSRSCRKCWGTGFILSKKSIKKRKKAELPVYHTSEFSHLLNYPEKIENRDLRELLIASKQRKTEVLSEKLTEYYIKRNELISAEEARINPNPPKVNNSGPLWSFERPQTMQEGRFDTSSDGTYFLLLRRNVDRDIRPYKYYLSFRTKDDKNQIINKIKLESRDIKNQIINWLKTNKIFYPRISYSPKKIGEIGILGEATVFQVIDKDNYLVKRGEILWISASSYGLVDGRSYNGDTLLQVVGPRQYKTSTGTRTVVQLKAVDVENLLRREAELHK